jgi:hypothetical protein
MLDYIDRNHLTRQQFEQGYRDRYGVGLSQKQKDVIDRHLGVKPVVAKTRFRVRQQRHVYVVFRRVSGAKEVQLVKGRKDNVVARYFRDKRGRLHRSGADGRFQRLSRKDRAGLGLSKKHAASVNKSSPTGDKKGRIEGDS